MASMPSALPDSEVIAQVCVIVLGLIVVWDAYWLTRQRIDIPNLGELPNGGFAWESERRNEIFRQWANLVTIAAMMVLPWMLAEISETPTTWIYIWDGLLFLHLLSLFLSKRYAVTSTHLFADGQRYEWERLRLPKHQSRHRIILLRKGWGPFAPLPLGGKRTILAIALERITILLSEEE